LFGGFPGTTPRSDLPQAVPRGEGGVGVIRHRPFPTGPVRNGARSGLSRFSCMNCPRSHGVYDSAGSTRPLRGCGPLRFADRSSKRAGCPERMLSDLHTQLAHSPRVNDTSPRALRHETHDRGPWRLATPSMCNSCIPYSIPVYPGDSARARNRRRNRNRWSSVVIVALISFPNFRLSQHQCEHAARHDKSFRQGDGCPQPPLEHLSFLNLQAQGGL